MYKFIIGNVRITVIDDTISKNAAINTARQAIAVANNQNKSLSHIELNLLDDSIETITTERGGSKLLRKNIKQSMLDAMLSAVKEKLYPTDTFSTQDTINTSSTSSLWYDEETGQEWHGIDVTTARDNLLAQFEDWYKSQ